MTVVDLFKLVDVIWFDVCFVIVLLFICKTIHHFVLGKANTKNQLLVESRRK